MALSDSIVWRYEDIIPLYVAAVLGLVTLFMVYLLLKDVGLPPGPTGLPLIGYWPYLNEETCHKQLDKLKEKYGDAFSFRVAGYLIISLGSNKALKELHVTKSDCFGDRCLDGGILNSTLGNGVGFANGELWRVMRKFFVLKFRDFGMVATKGDAAGSMYDSVNETVEEFRSLKGKPINVSEFITTKCHFVLKRVMFNDEGIRDEELNEIYHEYATVVSGLTTTNLLLFGKFAKYFVLPFISRYRAALKSHDKAMVIMRRIIDRYRSSYRENPSENIVHCFFKERDERKKKGDPTAEQFDEESMIMSVYQFITDGVLSVAYFIGAYMQALVEHPEEQEKMYKELIDVVGADRNPTLEDRSKLPYTNAFIYEVLRHTDMFPLFPSQICTKQTTINGYKIPVGAITLMNAWSIHHDSDTYENPYKFDPSRYVTTPNKPRAELPVTFGVGKRACIGEAFTMILTYLFVSAVVKNFRLALPEGSEKSSMLFFTLGKMEICFYPRSETKS